VVRCKVLIYWEHAILSQLSERKTVMIFIYVNHVGRQFTIDLETNEMTQGRCYGLFIRDESAKIFKLKKDKDVKTSGGYIYLNDMAVNMYGIADGSTKYFPAQRNDSTLIKILRYEYFMDKVFIYGNFKKRFNERRDKYRKAIAQSENKARANMVQS